MKKEHRAPEKPIGFLGKRSGSLTSVAVFSTKKTRQAIKARRDVVGVTGFEPAAPWSQTKCATKLRQTPKNIVYYTMFLYFCQVLIQNPSANNAEGLKYLIYLLSDKACNCSIDC